MAGYCRYPTIHQDNIVFLCEDDLWSVPAAGGMARRLTSNRGAVSAPALSPDGTRLAFIGREEGPAEVYTMPALGGPAQRLTFQSASADVVGWTQDGDRIVYASSACLPHPRVRWLWTVPAQGGVPERLPFGPANHIAYGPAGQIAIGRHTADPARWKRYRGGTAGRLWIDRAGDGEFVPLEPVQGNLTCPMWIDDRIYFVSDHEGVGNLYSCLPLGEDVRRHTHHEEYYVRAAATDRARIVYHAGAELYVYDVRADEGRRVDVDLRSPRVQCQRRFVRPSRYLQGAALHPDGRALATIVRGKLFTMANWEGAVLQHGERDSARYRIADWLNDGERLVALSDATGEEAIEVHSLSSRGEPKRLDGLDIGRVTQLAVSPASDQVVIANQRFELVLVDLDSGETRLLDESPFGRIAGMAWSPDGRWLAYGFRSTERTCSIKIAQVDSGECQLVTHPEFNDVGPAWDPEGQYLYFLSCRDFDPVYDHVHFELSFMQAERPMLVTLRKDAPHPFVPRPRPLSEDGKENSKDDGNSGDGNGKDKEGSDGDKGKCNPVEIDFDGIAERVLAFPGQGGRYGQIDGIKGKALFTSFPVEGTLAASQHGGEPPAKGTLHAYDFKERKQEVLADHVSGFGLSRDGKTLVYRAKEGLRVIKAGAKPDDKVDKGKKTRQSGWVDLGRVKASVIPQAEWRQMYREAWRLQRDYFWTEDMSGVDWQQVYERYLPLLDRVATRSEFSDLMWEMQGELGTSHCYEMGGDYPASPNYGQGFLAADMAYSDEAKGHVVTHIVRGDPWDERRDSPLNRPGVDVNEGDAIVAVGGQPVGPSRPVGELLVGLAKQELELTVRRAGSEEERTVTVKALSSEAEARYREWVSTNRVHVHGKTSGQVGYVHVPDMMGRGYAEFHRGYLAELAHPGLIVDVRFNSGGHVSPLVLEKLARRRVGYDVQRWGQPIPYPQESVLGPIVAITNEVAGSDGDIFSHCFKLMNIGLLVGTRTWGGVIGISPHQRFVDGGTTTQPEYSFWFEDVGWSVENYGTDPDIEVPYTPQDYRDGSDPQLDRAIEEILRQMEADPPKLPDFGQRPRLTLPKLPRA